MGRWRYLLVGVAGVLAVAGAHGQTIGGRALTIVPDSVNATRDWGTIVDRMVRGDELRVRLESADTLVGGRSVEQLTQYYKGLRVWGGNVARQFEGVTLMSVFGTVYQGLDMDVTPAISRDAARDALERQGGTLLLPETDPELVVLPDAGTFQLAWVGEVMLRRDIVRFFLDAKSGQIVRRYSMLQRQAANAAIGHGVGVLGDDKKVSATAASGTFLASDPLRPPVIVTYDMKGDVNRSLAALTNRTPLVTADIASNSLNNWTDAAVVDAHAYAAYTYDYYFKRFGRRGLDNANHRLNNLVHLVRRNDIFTAPDDILDFYENAFYCGDCAGGVMVYGEGLPGGVFLRSTGQRFDYFSGALDIVAHELTHGVTDFSSRLEYVNESGALNEAFSDMMGTSVEFFVQPAGSGPRQADYLIGEDIVVAVLPGALNGVRSMANPTLFGQPDHYSQRALLPPDDEHDNGGVHVNSGIPNQAFYLAIEGGTNRTSGIRVQGVGAANREQIEKVFYRAFTQLMPSNADFSMARAITLRAAQDLYGLNSGPYNAVRDAWSAVGVN
ncbi:MAG: M4 family metallopeptidase [Vicinamibacterales bacterium]